MNEFVARNGLIALDSSSISGPFVVTGSIVATSGISAGGNIGLGNSLTLNGSFVGATALTITAGGSDATITQTGNNSLVLTNPLGIYTFKKTAQTDFFVINQHSGLTYTIGNFGIGTTSPSGKLHVAGTSVLSGSILIGSSNGTSDGTWINSNGTINVIRSINGATYGLRVHNGAGWSGHNGIEAIAYQYAIYGAQGANGSPVAYPLSVGAAVFGTGGVGVQGLGATPTGDSGSIGVMASTLFVNNASNTALYDRNVSAHIVGTSQTVLKVDSGTVSNILFITSSGNVGIGVTTPSKRLEVYDSGSGDGIAIVRSSVTTQRVEIIPNDGTVSALIKGGGNNKPFYIASWANGGTPQPLYFGTNYTSGIDQVRMTIDATGSVGIGTTSPTFRLDINGSFRASGSITATSGSDYFDISHDITQPAQTGSQVYEVNITPTLRYTAPNQTQTALRVAATFTGSTALSSSQSNIIADFGSTSAGSQLVINDTTSGSIYMVNDVSGLPIIEANSNWDVFIYDYPNVVLKKTGSQIDITGKLKVSGSFILPLSQSTSPETGSAYWSGSFLYIYDGAQYRSASFS